MGVGEAEPSPAPGENADGGGGPVQRPRLLRGMRTSNFHRACLLSQNQTGQEGCAPIVAHISGSLTHNCGTACAVPTVAAGRLAVVIARAKPAPS